ncbi:MAG: AbrB/MazE/SpoVT family DNA-binding domain-containing protein, partial [Kiritimatiellaeota bacterium]|nr:AbrB/MazE/SpoVT family DNA-binding domain-containing protein [Kiritimatiellota bacterium]
MNAILKVNSRGTLTLPKPLRKVLGVADGGTLLCDVRGADVVLQPMMAYPIEMYTDERIAEFEEDANAIGDKIDALFEKMGWEYDPET